MRISAQVRNEGGRLEVAVSTSGSSSVLSISAKEGGRGSATNGGELLMLALATCYCNDLYREADRLGIVVTGCQVRASAQFRGVGLAAEAVTYAAKVESSSSAEKIELLLAETDRLAEVHNTLRAGCRVDRVAWADAAE